MFRLKAIRVGVVAVAVVFIALISVPAQAQKAPKLAKTPATVGSIGGAVTGEHGTPLSGARVTLTSEADKTQKTATTDANGEYGFENLTPGERSPHDDLEPEVSADAIMAHVVQGTKILREARDPDVWRFTTPDEVAARFDALSRHLGRRRAFWKFLLESWEKEGLLARKSA